MKWRLATAALSLCLATPARAQVARSDEGLSLAQAIATALSQEPAVRAAIADVEVARGMTLQAGLRANPMMSVERREEPGGTDMATDIRVDWPLELFRRGSRVAVANAELSVAEHVEADVRRQLIGDVEAEYGAVAAAQRELAVTDEMIAAATKQLEQLRARATQGATPTLDGDVMDVEVRRMQAERVIQVARSDRSLLRLKRLLGMAADASLQVSQSLEELVAGVAADTNVVATRPDIQASEARVRVEENRLVAARNEGRPDVTVFGSYMRMDTGFSQRGIGAGGSLERVRGQFNYLAAGAMVTVPLWNRQQGNIAVAVAARDGAEARLQAARLTASSEIAEARIRLLHARDAASLYQEGIRPLALRNLETVRETYQLGRATVFDVLAEQRRYLDVERAYAEALTEAYAAAASLRRATGELR